MKEQALAFGESEALFGLYTPPAADQPRRLAVVIPSTGLDPRCGPGRLHVQLAHTLAAQGHPVLRFDLAGLGDSEMLPGRDTRSAASELRAAMDALTVRGLGTRFALLGFGSGAHAVHEATRADPRVTAAAFVDGYRYPTVRHWIRRLLQQLGSRQPSDVLPDDPQPDLNPRAGDALHDVPAREVLFYVQPPQARTQADLVDFMQRGVALCYLYTGQVAADYSYARQLLHAFPILRGYRDLTLRYQPDGDHRFGRRANRDAVIALLRDWLSGLPEPG